MVIETGGAVVTGAGVDGACEDGEDMHPADSMAAIRTRATVAPGITKVLVCIPFTFLDLILNLGAAAPTPPRAMPDAQNASPGFALRNYRNTEFFSRLPV
jgi:hypothetical protein